MFFRKYPVSGVCKNKKKPKPGKCIANVFHRQSLKIWLEYCKYFNHRFKSSKKKRLLLAETYYHRCPAPKKFGTSPARSFCSQRFSHTVPIRQKARHCSKYVSVSSNFPCLAKALASCMDGPNELSWGEPSDWPALYN